jgi:DNA-binding NtrC family response regulator
MRFLISIPVTQLAAEETDLLEQALALGFEPGRDRHQGETEGEAENAGPATIFCRGEVIQAEDLPREVRGAAPDGGGGGMAWDPEDDLATAKKKLVDRFGRAMVTEALREHGGNISQAARRLGLHRQSLQQKLHELGISAESFRGA